MSTDHLVSRVTRFFGSDSGAEAWYECFGCGQRFELQYHSCPDCGSFRVERTEWVTD